MPPPDMEFEDPKPKTIIRRARSVEDEEDDVFGEEMDALEDDDGTEVSDPDPEDAEQEVLDRPRVSLAANRRKERDTKKSPGRTAVSERVSEDFADILEDLEFGVEAHKISVERLEPQYDPHNPHRRIAGHCGTFSRAIDKDDIQKQYGGGRYAVIVRGPNELTGRGSQIKARRVVEIAGAPIPLPDPRAEAERRKKEEQKQNDLIEKLLEREDKRAAKAEEQALALQTKLQETQMNLVELFAKLNENKTDPMASMAPVLEAMREDARRRDEAAREQAARLEAQRREDREEQRRKDEEERRRHEKEMQLQQQQFEKQMEQMRLQMEMQREQVKAEAAAQQANMQMMLQFMTKTDSDKEARTRESSEMQMKMFTQMSEMQRNSLETQMAIVMEQLKDAKNKDDFFSHLEKFQMLQGLFNPQEPDDRETWEKVLDRVGETVPGVVAGLGALRRGVQPQQEVPQQPQPVLQPGQMAPGTVAVVDDIEQHVPYKAEQQPRQALPPAQESSRAQASEAEPESEQAQSAESTEDQGAPTNPLTEFPENYAGQTNEKVLTELVYRLDLAVDRDLSPDELYEKCVMPLPEAIKLLLKALPTDTLIEFIDGNVPMDWPVRSLAGEQLVRQAHERLREAA